MNSVKVLFFAGVLVGAQSTCWLDGQKISNDEQGIPNDKVIFITFYPLVFTVPYSICNINSATITYLR